MSSPVAAIPGPTEALNRGPLLPMPQLPSASPSQPSPESERLEREVDRLERAFEWAQRERAPTAELEQKLKTSKLRLTELQGTLQAPGAGPEAAFLEEQLRLLRKEVEELREGKRQVEREAFMMLQHFDQEREEIEEELRASRDRINDLDQLILSLQTGHDDTPIETLIREQEELKRGLRFKTDEFDRFEKQMRLEREQDQRQLQEARLTIERLQGLIEQTQTRASERIRKLEERLDGEG